MGSLKMIWFKREQGNPQIATLIKLASLLAMVVLPTIGAAQNYEALPIHADYVFPERSDFDSDRAYRDAFRTVKNRLSAARSAVGEAVKSGSANFGADGDKYMLQYRLASMTQPEDRYLSRLGSARADFLKLYMDRSSPAVRRNVIAKVLPQLEKLALSEQFHPAVRLNAVTMIGLLDARVGESSSPPVPSPEAYASLKKIWATADTLDAVRAGALSGIRRFAEISRRSASEESIAGEIKGEMIAILDGKAAGQDKWKPDFDYWMKRRATQILGFIGEGDDTVAAIAKVMKQPSGENERNNFWLRHDGLVALANLKFNRLNLSLIHI